MAQTKHQVQRISFTYGVLPPRDLFTYRFERVCPEGKYDIRNCRRVGSATFTEPELWQEVETAASEFTRAEDDAAGDKAGEWASCVLETLGIEWI